MGAEGGGSARQRPRADEHMGTNPEHGRKRPFPTGQGRSGKTSWRKKGSSLLCFPDWVPIKVSPWPGDDPSLSSDSSFMWAPSSWPYLGDEWGFGVSQTWLRSQFCTNLPVVMMGLSFPTCTMGRSVVKFPPGLPPLLQS